MNAAMRIPEPTLDFWADRFIAAGLAEVMTFEQYMQLTPALRERRGLVMLDADARMSRRLDREYPTAALHGEALIEPIHHGVKQNRSPWYRNNHRRY